MSQAEIALCLLANGKSSLQRGKPGKADLPAFVPRMSAALAKRAPFSPAAKRHRKIRWDLSITGSNDCFNDVVLNPQHCEKPRAAAIAQQFTNRSPPAPNGNCRPT
jgi:hypothetical protein